jgi:hypothetical protein
VQKKNQTAKQYKTFPAQQLAQTTHRNTFLFMPLSSSIARRAGSKPRCILEKDAAAVDIAAGCYR